MGFFKDFKWFSTAKEKSKSIPSPIAAPDMANVCIRCTKKQILGAKIIVIKHNNRIYNDYTTPKMYLRNFYSRAPKFFYSKIIKQPQISKMFNDQKPSK